jgi:hypothetical protein
LVITEDRSGRVHDVEFRLQDCLRAKHNSGHKPVTAEPTLRPRRAKPHPT